MSYGQKISYNSHFLIIHKIDGRKKMSSFRQLLSSKDETSCSLFTIAAFFAIFVAVLKLFIIQPSKVKSPPSPPKLPIIGNLHQIGSLPHRSLSALAQRYGPLMLLHFGKVPVLVVSSSDAAREILKTHDIIFANRPKSTPFEKLFFDCKDVIMASYGEYWRQLKSICVVHLLSNKRIHSVRNVRVEEVALMIEKIKLSAASSSPINLSDALFTLTNNIICRVALGKKYSEGEVGSRFRRILEEFVELTGAFHVGDYIPWLSWVCHFNGLNASLEKMAKELDDFHDEIIQEHENKMVTSSQVVDDHKDFVDILLCVQKEHKLGFPIDRVTIRALISDMFGAGTDTTFTVLEWAMTELLRHPKIMKELQNEVRGIVGGKSDITEEDLIKMNYLKAVIKETMRFHPPIPLLVPRQSTQDVKINGYDIAAGTHVYINYWAISKDPLKWDQPEEFLPERFLNSSINFQGQDLQFIPFGAGRRSCPGVEFSMRAVELALANLLNEFDWSLPDETKGQPLDITESSGLIAHRKFPLVAVATPRTF